MDISQIHELFLRSGKVSIDTRKIEPGSMFVAIKGERFDANTFAAEALEKGASAVVIDNPQYHIDDRTILVDDSLTAMQELAKFHRSYLGLPIIALTGSNGKTTTKELINAVLSTRYSTGATIGNLNNHIGVPLTLLSFSEQTEIGIVEMGANHQKEIEFLCRIATPDFGYITNFGKAHLEGFGGAEGVIKGKSELYQYLRSNAGTVFVNTDDLIQVKNSEGINGFTFGASEAADVRIDSVQAAPFVSLNFNGTYAQSNLIGIYNAPNIAAAAAIGTYFKIDPSSIAEAIRNYTPDNNRSQLMQKGSNQIILDAYNANPSSMTAAIANLRSIHAISKVAILGDMFELGAESIHEHRNIVETAINFSDVRFIFVGKDFYSCVRENDNLLFFENFESLSKYISNSKFENSTILIKGSRGMALERILDVLQ